MNPHLLTNIMVVVEKLPITPSSRSSRQLNNVGLQVCMSSVCACVCLFVIPSHRFPLGLGSLFLKLGEFSAVMNTDQQLPHQQSCQAQQEDGADDRRHRYQDIRTFRTLYIHANTQRVRVRKTFQKVIDEVVVLETRLQTTTQWARSCEIFILCCLGLGVDRESTFF